MALQDILAQIKKEVESKLNKLDNEFKSKEKEINEKYEKLIDEAKKEKTVKVEQGKEKILEKMTTHARMEAKNKLTEAKRQLIEKVFEKALDELADSKDYEKFVVNLLKKSDIDEEDVHVISAKGKEDITKSALEKSGKKYEMAKETAQIKGGFILRSKKVEIDNSFESILYKEIKDEAELKAAEALFA